MRILYDSKQLHFKDPFGTLQPNQECTLHMHIPTQIQIKAVECIVNWEDGRTAKTFPLTLEDRIGPYDVFGGTFCLEEKGLYFYYFRITTVTGSFRLFKYGDDTNMEAGDCWQLSCIPADFVTPDWAKGAVIYQVFPDRFHKAGYCDLTGKLTPYTTHRNWNEEVDWQPDENGDVLNNDFYGGNFRGITEKMDYIASLGTEILYLNPISKSFSSHRYDTGDYKTPDPMLGTMEDFRAMCDAAHQRGIKVVLDGVYSHTGSDSLYFNRKGNFPGVGAYQSRDSEFFDWYSFQSWPNHYTSWWNFDTLPTVDKMNPAFIDYIIEAEDSVVAYWLRNGADGFRLDVVDELPDAFVLKLKNRIRAIRPDALVIGEVWEDASNKYAYGVRRSGCNRPGVGPVFYGKAAFFQRDGGGINLGKTQSALRLLEYRLLARKAGNQIGGFLGCGQAFPFRLLVFGENTRGKRLVTVGAHALNVNADRGAGNGDSQRSLTVGKGKFRTVYRPTAVRLLGKGEAFGAQAQAALQSIAE